MRMKKTLNNNMIYDKPNMHIRNQEGRKIVAGQRRLRKEQMQELHREYQTVFDKTKEEECDKDSRTELCTPNSSLRQNHYSLIWFRELPLSTFYTPYKNYICFVS